MMRRQLGFLVLLGLPLWGWAEGPEPAELIARMSEAVRTQTYSGTVVYSSDARMETLRVLHEFRNGEVRERLSSLTGDAREIYRNNEEVICVLPEQKIITVDRRAHQAASLLPSLRQDNITAMADRYRFEHLGEKRIAGRMCEGVRVSPRDDMRYGYEYWLDAETSLPLRVIVLNPDGERIEEMMFTDITFGEHFDDARFERDSASDDYRVIRHADESPRLRVPARWSLRESPPGFRKISHSVRKGADDRVPVEHFLFSDGLATISVYGANAADGRLDDMAPQSSRMGALNVASRVIDGHQVTVVGEVPAVTVQWVVDRLSLESAQSDTAAAFEPLPEPVGEAGDD
jgi:sigma-E factor negative regulatory protein RseB